MDGVEQIVLQEGIGTGTVDRDRAHRRGEGVGRPDHQREEEPRGDEADEQRDPDHPLVDVAPRSTGEQREIPGKDRPPQEDRALQRGPQSGHREQQRRFPRVVRGHEGQGEVVRDERAFHRDDGDDGADEHQVGIRAATPRELRLRPDEARRHQHDADERPEQADQDADVADQSVHRRPVGAPAVSALSPPQCTSPFGPRTLAGWAAM